MVVGINCGHTVTGAGYGAVGLIKESEHTRLVGYVLMDKLKEAGIKVVDCTIDKADSQQEYLTKVVELANREKMDWFISIHFNSSVLHSGKGVEVYTYRGKKYSNAMEICSNLEALGFVNRGIKDGTNLYVVRKTKAKAILVEVCFCDNQTDVDTYNHIGAENAVANAIFNSIYKYDGTFTEIRLQEKKMFIDFVGKIAKKDWKERKIMLPSVVIAQAIKESAWGTSELARKANALFGIKDNDWSGRIYIKNATEQKADGSYYAVADTRWRAYDSWEQSILNHNDYIAARSTDGGKTLRYFPIIGCNNYVLVCQYLQECGYATSITYAESLINDYIEKYHLVLYDEAED